MSDYTDILEALASNDYYKVKSRIYSLINDSKFLKIIIKINDPFIFDHFIKMCEYKMDTSYLHEMRNDYLKSILLDYNKITIIPDRWVTEYIISYFFQDNYYNFMANYYQMEYYLRSTKKDLVSKDNLAIYQEFKELRNMTLESKIELFKKYYQRNNIMELLYDDIKKVREDSHKMLVDNVLKLNHDSELYNEDITNRFGVDTYVLDGEKFYGFVRCLSVRRDDLSNNEDKVFSQKRRLGYSFSYIGDKNISTTDENGENVTLFYDQIDYKNIMYVHHSDLHAKKMIEQDDYLSLKENEITTPSSLIASTNKYNEIYIKWSEEGIKPTAVICYDRVTMNDISFAKKYHLAILFINSKKYSKPKTYEDDFERNTYVI